MTAISSLELIILFPGVSKRVSDKKRIQKCRCNHGYTREKAICNCSRCLGGYQVVCCTSDFDSTSIFVYGPNFV